MTSYILNTSLNNLNTFQVKTGGEASELPVALIQQTVEEEEPSRKVSFGTAVTVIGKQLIYQGQLQ